jgi:hypothetical protein
MKTNVVVGFASEPQTLKAERVVWIHDVFQPAPTAEPANLHVNLSDVAERAAGEHRRHGRLSDVINTLSSQ